MAIYPAAPVQMYHTVTLLSTQDYQLVETIIPTNLQTTMRLVNRGEDLLHDSIRRVRLTDATWTFLGICETDPTKLPYGFMVMLLVRFDNGEKTVMRLCFNEWIPYLLIGQRESESNSMIPLYTLLEFPPIVDSRPLIRLQEIIECMPAIITPIVRI